MTFTTAISCLAAQRRRLALTSKALGRVRVKAGTWEEDKHPRDDAGKFGEGGHANPSKPDKPKLADKPAGDDAAKRPTFSPATIADRKEKPAFFFDKDHPDEIVAVSVPKEGAKFREHEGFAFVSPQQEAFSPAAHQIAATELTEGMEACIFANVDEGKLDKIEAFAKRAEAIVNQVRDMHEQSGYSRYGDEHMETVTADPLYEAMGQAHDRIQTACDDFAASITDDDPEGDGETFETNVGHAIGEMEEAHQTFFADLENAVTADNEKTEAQEAEVEEWADDLNSSSYEGYTIDEVRADLDDYNRQAEEAGNIYRLQLTVDDDDPAAWNVDVVHFEDHPDYKPDEKKKE